MTNDLIQKLFIKPPPSGKDFLNPDNEWLPKHIIDEIYDEIKEDFISIVDENKYYRTICLYGSTRQGKTFLARLLILYTIVFLNHLRDISTFYGVSGSSQLVIFLISFKFEKVAEVYLRPISKLLSLSKRFKKVHKNKVLDYFNLYGPDIIPYSETTSVYSHAHFMFPRDIYIVSGNKELTTMLGIDILQAYISEIAYFIEVAGISDLEIFRLYSDVSERILATVGRRKLAFTYLDTSAYTLENKIENYIWNVLRYDNETYFKSRSRWEIKQILEKNCPIYLKTKKTFKVFLGDSKYPPRIFKEDEIIPNSYLHSLIKEVPIDYLKDFEADLQRSICNILGYPISNEYRILNLKYVYFMFYDNIPNVESYILCESKEYPERYLFNQIENLFFKNITIDRKVFYINPYSPRYIGIDLAFSGKGDLAAISCIHRTLDKNGEPIFYVDFSFALISFYSRISLEAIQYFITDLIHYGNLNIKGISLEMSGSEQIKQYLERNDLNVVYTSLSPKNTAPYLLLSSLIHSCRIISGKNIFLKNNLLSLVKKTIKTNDKIVEIIDHTIGTSPIIYNQNFETSECGLHNKDVSDSLVQAIMAFYKCGGEKEQITDHIDWYSMEEAQTKINNIETSINFYSKIEEIQKKHIEINNERILYNQNVSNYKDYIKKRNEFINNTYNKLKKSF